MTDMRDVEIGRLREKLRRQHRSVAEWQKTQRAHVQRLRRANADLHKQLEAREGRALAELKQRVQAQAEAIELYCARWQRVLRWGLAWRNRKTLQHESSRAVAVAEVLAATTDLHRGDLQVLQ